MKNLPNALSVLRIVLAVCLLFISPLSTVFYIVYLICCISDVADGWLARRMDAKSILGARLDSAGDFVLVAVLLLRLIPEIRPVGSVLIWVGAVALLRICAAIVAKIRFGRLGFLHTFGNKITGALLFLYPLSLGMTRSHVPQYFLCAVATLSAVEELLIELTARKWDGDIKSFWQGGK